MPDRTPIEWTDATWNPIRGCTRVSEGCRNCYAEVIAARFSDPGQWGHGLARRIPLPGGGTDHRWTGRVELAEAALDLPLRWRRPRRIFVNSTSDLFHESVPDAWIDRVFAVMALARRHTFQILTKRPERMRGYVASLRSMAITEGRVERMAEKLADARGWDRDVAATVVFEAVHDGLTNVWLGVSAEDQATADARIPHLLATPAAVRFVSAEPLLGALRIDRLGPGSAGGWITDALRGTRWPDLDEAGAITSHTGRLDWVIVGGESGPGARPMHPDWARSLRDQCQAAGVPFFFKQWGEWGPDTGPEADGTDRELEGRDRCAWWDGRAWHIVADSYAAPWEAGISVGEWLYLKGKKRNGATFDGREWREFPDA